MKILQLIPHLASPFLDFIYPPTCVCCNTSLQNGNQKVCKDCWNAIPAITKEHPLYQETRTKLLAEGYISDLVSCFVFESNGPFQHIVHALKYKEYKSFGIELGEWIGRLMRDWSIEADIIIPVPLHRIKHRERGYNQSEFIAQGIASVVKKPILMDVVRRTRYTQTQTRLNIEERRKNMEGAFEMVSNVSNILDGKSCLIVDDVITTGATINSCAKEILAVGDSTIIAASAALAN